MTMDYTISKLAEVDPVFREVVSKLYPAADPRELWDLSKSMPDQSAVHANGGKKKDNGKKGLAAGLLAGTAIETLAAKETIKPLSDDIKAARPVARQAGSVGGKLKAFKSLGPGKGRLGSATKAGLMVGNLAVGLGAAKELMKPAKPKNSVSKADIMELCEPIIKARKEGVITTAKALEMIDEIEKSGLTSRVIGGAAGRVTGPMIFTGEGVARTKGVRGVLDAHKEFVVKPNAEKFRAGQNAGIKRGRAAVAGAAVAGTGAVAYNKGKRKAAQEVEMVGKSDSSDYEFSGDISKFDNDKRQVFGWCSLSKVDGQDVVDLQNDYITIEEIEKSAYDYVKKSRKGGDMHARVGEEPVHTSDMIESVIITPDKLRSMGVPDEAISKVNTGWWVGFQVNDDEQWAKVKSGERAGFSIHGKGARVEKMLEDAS